VWLKLPLKLKLFLLLLIVHVVSFSLGAGWLIEWNRQTRLEDIYDRVDVQGDMLEDVLELHDGHLTSNRNSEVRRELEREESTYLLVLDAENAIIDESNGPNEKEREQLRSKILSHPMKVDQLWLLKAEGQRWIVQSERVERASADGAKISGYHHFAINAEQNLQDLDRFSRIVVGGCIILSLCASSASGFLVSYSTRNLRRFAQELRSKNPLKADTIDFRPLSLEEMHLHESYQDMKELVRLGAESQRLFIAHASHELKTPIAAALAVTELALSRKREASEYEALHMQVFDELQVLKRLSNVLLDLASLEDSAFDFRQSGWTDLDNVLSVAIERWSAAAYLKGITIKVEDMIRVLLPGREELWETVLSNLFDNSIKYGKAQGLVRISVNQSDDGWFVIKIEDDGIGMGPKELSRMGEVFFKGDSSHNRTGSFGLGFAHTKRIVTRLGGLVSVQSEPGVGTQVLICVQGRILVT
jgi:two-component system heavy metal sensor histidine kinase CusS